MNKIVRSKWKSFWFFLSKIIGKPLSPLPKILHSIAGASKLFGVPLHTIRLPQKFTVLTHDGKLSWSVGGGGKKWELLNYFLSSRILCADERLSDFPAKSWIQQSFSNHCQFSRPSKKKVNFSGQNMAEKCENRADKISRQKSAYEILKIHRNWKPPSVCLGKLSKKPGNFKIWLTVRVGGSPLPAWP